MYYIIINSIAILENNIRKTSFIEFLQYDFKRFNVEKLRSGVAVETGKVTNILNKKCMFG